MDNSPINREQEMTTGMEVELLVRTETSGCGRSGCPAIFATSRDTFVIQGRKLSPMEQESLANQVDAPVPEQEEVVEVPRAILVKLLDHLRND